jgi:lipoprotein Spr
MWSFIWINRQQDSQKSDRRLDSPNCFVFSSIEFLKDWVLPKDLLYMHVLFLWVASLVLAPAPAYAQMSWSPVLPITDPEVPLLDVMPSSNRSEVLMDEAVRERFLSLAADWEGVRYRIGGNSRAGIDCSALVQTWFLDVFGTPLPRSSREQYHVGNTVEREELRPGDLVFFSNRRTISHVGVYVGDGQFAHASSSQGVTVSRLEETYWARRYSGARRVLSMDILPHSDDTIFLAGLDLSASSEPVSLPPALFGSTNPASGTTSGTSRRAGW